MINKMLMFNVIFVQAVTQKQFRYPADPRRSLQDGILLCEWVCTLRRSVVFVINVSQSINTLRYDIWSILQCWACAKNRRVALFLLRCIKMYCNGCHITSGIGGGGLSPPLLCQPIAYQIFIPRADTAPPPCSQLCLWSLKIQEAKLSLG